ncbi:hypothetical protein SAMN05720354_108127 [Nitrosospira sp. Nsp1]|nr:hypothetical protein SAMN05720354_108127 [Nitrosospira sp. Nsp1]
MTYGLAVQAHLKFVASHSYLRKAGQCQTSFLNVIKNLSALCGLSCANFLEVVFSLWMLQ